LALRPVIETEALAFAVAQIIPTEIDKINIHNASYRAMHLAIEALSIKTEFIIVDGNRFIPYPELPHQCVVNGDGKFLSIAAALILEKTYRDDYMLQLAQQFAMYDWHANKGYPTIKHRQAVLAHGPSPYHRRSFRVTDPQLKLF